MKANIRGTEIYFDVMGMALAPLKNNEFEERPTLFMLHGGPGGDHLRFKQHSLELQEWAQLIFIDHRGCGRSKKTKRQDYTLENNIEDIEALRKYLGLKKICILGTSYGGIVAQGYALRYPKHVDKLILVATAPSYRFIDEAKQYIQTHGNKKQIKLCQHLWDGTFKDPRHVLQFFKEMNSVYSTKPKRNKKERKTQTIWSHEALNEGFGNFLRHYDYTSKLKKITCPTLVLAGKEDWICSPSQAKILAQNIKRAKLKIFSHCGHAVAVDAHKKYINSIKRFLKA